ncbi:conserved hypothetical protein [Histoplasma capsulatum var. duboisii H88]|uniref:Aminodeoxychorismate lyase n=1 Tax=Ajellomyces capsulatus (strain H88) TaxID=544711 RepID=F0UGV7_AJEC8|nr:conserved hypothetical protein [Histoplasma capsulatum var. duboisii H88]QSS55965.1 hypothetical protein I7I53_03999 [Histoplasma capsulatum var. duboisii H88]
MQPSQTPTESHNFQITSALRYDPDLPRIPHIPDTYPAPQTSPYYLLSYHYDRLLAAAVDFKWSAAITLLQQQPRETAIAQLAQKVNEHTQSNPAHPWRIRVLLNAVGVITVEAVPILPNPSSAPSIFVLPEKPDFSRLLPRNGDGACSGTASTERIETWTLRLDTEPTSPSLFTRHKTTVRDQYTASRERAGITASPHDKTEVLLYNPAGEVMEGSITTVYFRRRRKQGPGPAAASGSTSTPGEAGDGDCNSVDDPGYYWVTPPLSSGGNAGTSRRYALTAQMCMEEVVRVEELQELEGENDRVWLSNGVRGFMPAILKLNR